MIVFNENDFNISKIKRESKLFNLNTIAKYWIYGLKQTNNPILYIRYDNENRDNVEIKKDEIEKFFKFNGLQNIEFEYRDRYDNDISIGIRKDLRKHVILAAAILRTIVYCLEDKINLRKDYKLPGLPKFE